MKPNAPAADRAVRVTRREFIGRASLLGAGLVASATLTRWAHAGKAQRITILHTADIHAQLEVHDEFFYEGGKAVFKRRGAEKSKRGRREIRVFAAFDETTHQLYKVSVS